jgi:hypothetical protein
MRSIKKMALLAAAAAVVVAFAAPAAASASNWTEKGAELKSNLEWTKTGSFSFSGPFKITGSQGSLSCQVNGSVSLGAEGQGQVKEFTIAPGSCSLGGLFKVCPGVKSVTANTLPWTANASGTAASPTITINGVSLTLTLTGSGECSGYAVGFTGKMTATPDKANGFSSLALTGTLSNSSGNVTVTGSTESVTPAGTYGIAQHSVVVAVKGTLGWTGSLGDTYCNVSGSATLVAGSEGQLTSLTPSSCHSGGLISASCGSSGGWSPTMPWTLVDNGTTIAVKNVSIATCGFLGSFTGELTATPDNPSAISSTALYGRLTDAGSSLTWDGSLSWTPAGVYGL